jgi:hypothetical protein
MAMTVTATMSGTAANEHIYLWIRVLTGATEAGGASATGIAPSGGAGVTATLTPNFSSSLPCYALSGDNSAGPLTAAGNNTIDSSSADPDTWEAGFGRYTGTVTAATLLTFGASSFGTGGCDYGTWACYEVPSSGGGTPAVDASSPALASATGAGIKTVTSASFTPPAGSVVVAMIVGGGTGSSGSMVMTVTGGGLTWTQRAGSATVTDQDTFVFTATAAGGAAPGQASAWQLPWPPALTQAFGPGAPFTATSFQIDAAPQVQVTAGLATAAAAAAAPSFSLYITGLGGTGAGYFADQNGNPRMVLGDAAWALPGNAGRWNSGNWQADFDTYLASRAAQGFTVIYAKPVGTTQSGNLDDNGKTFDSLYPFQGGTPSTGAAGANPSSGLTAAFWARIDYFLASALAKGITVFLNAIGYSSDFDAGPGPLAGKSTTEFTAYGTALGTRYASQPNLIWNLADDYFGDNDALVTAFLAGLRGAGDTHAVSIENFPETTSRQALDTGTAAAWGAAHGQYNFCYSYNVTYYGIEKAYLESSPVPVIQGDGYFYQGGSTYAGGSGAFAYDRAIRQDAWHAITAGARGIIHGSESVWQWASTSLASSGTDWYYASNAGNIRALVESLPGWHTLVPDTGSALVTGGRGTHASSLSSGGGGGQYEVAFTDSYVTASRTPDTGSGSALALIYLSHGTTITVDQAKMAAGYTASWADPVTGALSAATAGSTYNSTAKGSNSQGDPDWVLVLQAPLSASAPAGLASGTGTAQAPAAAAGVSSTLASGTGTAQNPAAAAGASAAVAAGAGAAQGPVPAVAVLAGAATGTGAAQPAAAAVGAPGGIATGTGAAQNATVSTSSSGAAAAGLASGTGAAQGAAAAAGVNAPAATGAGTAQGPSAAAAPSAGLATGTGAGQAPALAIGASAGLAAGAGAAQNATASTSSAGTAAARLATGTGAAQPPAAAVAVSAGLASGAGAAQGAAGQASRTVIAGLATGAGAAQNPALTLTAIAHAAAAHALAAALGATAAAQGAFTVGSLTAADVPLATLGASAATAGQATLTASDSRTGGPS